MFRRIRRELLFHTISNSFSKMICSDGYRSVMVSFVDPWVIPASSEAVVGRRYGVPVATIKGMEYRLGIWNSCRIPQAQYPSIGHVAILRLEHAKRYAMAASMVFFWAQTSALEIVGTTNRFRVHHDTIRVAKRMHQLIGALIQ